MTSNSTSDFICKGAAVSSDGQFLVGHFGSVREPSVKLLKLWSLKSGELIDTINAHDAIQSLVTTKDVKTLIVTKTDGSTAFLDFQTGQQLGSIQAPAFSFYGLRLSQNRSIVAGVSYGQNPITVWDLSAGRVINTFQLESYTCAALSPDGTILVAGNETYEGGLIKVWDVPSGRELHSLVASDYIPREYSPYLEGSGDECRGVRVVAISPDNQTILCDPRSGGTQLWRLNREQEYEKFEVLGHKFSGIGDFSVDGQWAIDGSGKVINLKPIQAIQNARGKSFIVRAIPISQDGRILARLTISQGYSQIEVQDKATGKTIGVFAKEPVKTYWHS